MVQLIDDNNLSVSFQNFYSPAIKDALKDMPGAKYEAKSKSWTVSAQLKDELVTRVHNLCRAEGVSIMKPPSFVWELKRSPVPFSSNRYDRN